MHKNVRIYVYDIAAPHVSILFWITVLYFRLEMTSLEGSGLLTF